MRLKPGFALRDGQYVLQEYLGGGGQADVWRARKKTSLGVQLDVAIKLATPEHSRLADHELQRLSFLEEAQITEYLRQSEHFIKVRDAFELPDYTSFGLELELIEGMTLETLQEEYASQYGKRLPWFLSLSLGYQVLRGLFHAHTAKDGQQPLGLIHRDIKPANLMLSTQGVVKILDLGLAKWQQRDQALQTAPGYRRLSYGYAAPEQVTGQTLSAQTDIFAAGVVMYEMLTGRGLFGDPHDPAYVIKVAQLQQQPPVSPCSWVAEIPIALGDWLLSLLAYAPTDRPDSAWVASESLIRLLKQHQAFLEPHEIARWWQEHFGRSPQPRTHTAWYNIFATPSVFASEASEASETSEASLRSSRTESPDRTVDEMTPFDHPLVPQYAGATLEEVVSPPQEPSFHAHSLDETSKEVSTISPVVRRLVSAYWWGGGIALVVLVLGVLWWNNKSPQTQPDPIQHHANAPHTRIAPHRSKGVRLHDVPTRDIPTPQKDRDGYSPSEQHEENTPQEQDASSSVQEPSLVRSLPPRSRKRKRLNSHLRRPTKRRAAISSRVPQRSVSLSPPIRKVRASEPSDIRRLQPPILQRPQPPSLRRVALAPTVPVQKIALSIHVTPPCKLVDQSFRGYGMASDFVLHLPPGSYDFQCVNREKNFFWKFRAALSGGEAKKRITRRLSMGRLFVRSVPWSTVSLPPLGRIGHSHTMIMLPEGKHRLLLHKQGDRLISKVLDVSVQGGQEVRPPLVQW